MVTAEEIGRIPVFAALSVADCERLSRVAADIALVAGKSAAYEGGERALFALLEGRIEAVKLVDGVERVVGQRHPGELFGEVPVTLGTTFPVGFRAAEASRVMRIESSDFFAAGGRGLPRAPGHRWQDGGAAGAPPGRGAARAGNRAGCGRVRHGDRRGRPGRPGRRRLRRVRGAPHDRDRARGARRAGGHLVT